MQQYVMGVGAAIFMILVLLVPLFAVAYLTSPRPARLTPLLLFVAFLALDFLLLFLFRIVKVIPPWGGWNWQGKLLEVAWLVLLVACVPGFTAAVTGLTFTTSPGSRRVLLTVCAIYILVNTPFQFLLGANATLRVKRPALLYQATLPGLGEEFLYRGVLLALLNEVFGRPWRLLNAGCGWGLIIISVMFGLSHGLDVRGFGIHHVYWIEMIYAFVMGVVLAWLRERTGSVWPGVVFHNMANVMSLFFV